MDAESGTTFNTTTDTGSRLTYGTSSTNTKNSKRKTDYFDRKRVYSERVSRLESNKGSSIRKRNSSNLSGDLRFETEQDAQGDDDGIETIDEEAELLNFKRGKKKLKMPSTDKSQLGKKGRRLLKKMQFRNGVVPAPPRPIQLDLK